jgi:hypothetical protein
MRLCLEPHRDTAPFSLAAFFQCGKEEGNNAQHIDNKGLVVVIHGPRSRWNKCKLFDNKDLQTFFTAISGKMGKKFEVLHSKN